MTLKLDGYFLGPMLHHPIFFLKKIRVTLESRTFISVPVLVTFTLYLLTPFLSNIRIKIADDTVNRPFL